MKAATEISLPQIVEFEFSSSSQEEDVDVSSPPTRVVTTNSPIALPQQINSNPPLSQVLRRSERERRLPGKFNDFVLDGIFAPRFISSNTDNQLNDEVMDNVEDENVEVQEENTADNIQDAATSLRPRHNQINLLSILDIMC